MIAKLLAAMLMVHLAGAVEIKGQCNSDEGVIEATLDLWKYRTRSGEVGRRSTLYVRQMKGKVLRKVHYAFNIDDGVFDRFYSHENEIMLDMRGITFISEITDQDLEGAPRALVVDDFFAYESAIICGENERKLMLIAEDSASLGPILGIDMIPLQLSDGDAAIMPWCIQVLWIVQKIKERIAQAAKTYQANPVLNQPSLPWTSRLRLMGIIKS